MWLAAGKRVRLNSTMYERFTDRAQRVMDLAVREAMRLNHEYIGTEHILLGLLAERHGVARGALGNLGVDLEMARRHVPPPLPQSKMSVELPLSPRAAQAISFSREECANLSHHYVGTEHLILGLTRQAEGGAAEALSSMGLKREDIRRQVLNLLGHHPEEP
jgi:ATP-dependent Clp protease ATP-binding subunit ClpC